jgi:hypothetical protein
MLLLRGICFPQAEKTTYAPLLFGIIEGLVAETQGVLIVDVASGWRDHFHHPG